MKELIVSATSVKGIEAGQTVTASGVADFQVGSLGWIRLTNGPLVHITEPGPHMLSVEVHNQHPNANQEIHLSVTVDDDGVWNLKSVRVVSADRQLVHRGADVPRRPDARDLHSAFEHPVVVRGKAA